MATYIVRPYFGYDCDSEQGFNNGHYLDDIEVIAETEEDAIDQAMRLYQQDHALHPGAEIDGEFGDGTIYWVLRYVDTDGNEVSKEIDVGFYEGPYQYQYIDFNAVEIVTDDISYNQEPEINPDR